MNKDLTVGDASKVLWRFCLPLFGSIIFQQIYNIADSLVAGRLIGENALAAVGNSYEITLIFIAFAFGCNIGCSVVVARLFGAKDFKQMKSAISTALISSGIICLILMLIGILGGSTILKAIDTPDLILADSKLYLDIYCYGLPFLFFYNLSTGIFSALGDSKTPFYFLAFSSTANIFVDYYFVKYLKMGISGVAWATFLCQGISCILALIVVFKRVSKMEEGLKAPLFSKDLFKQLALIAIPSILQQSFISFGNIIIQRVINAYGPGVIAGYAASIKLNNLVITSFSTIGNGISNYTAQNLGANKKERINEGFKAGIKMVWLIALPLVLLYVAFPANLVGFFMNEPSAIAIETGVLILRIFAPFYFVVSLKLVCDGFLRGAIKMKSFMIDTFTDLILRVVLAIVLSKQFGSIGIWSAWPIGWIIATVMAYIFYRDFEKKLWLSN